MSRKANGKHRRQKPATAAQKLAQSYACGHCRSTVRGVHRDAHGVNHIDVQHDDSCPILRGAVADTGDVMRAATRAGITAMAVRIEGGE